MNQQEYQQARLSRDPRFDGVFYTAVKTTGIFCRPICPATPPKEQNVEYFETASEALVSGYRPCLRCRPESAPFSPAWAGTETTIKRALSIIHESGFNGIKLSELAARLGITDRYLRKLFEQHLGVSPKAYLQHQQILFAKSLLHQTQIPINQIAYAAGFNNVRRFNDAFKRISHKTPSEVRRKQGSNSAIRIQLNYQPPFHWQHWHDFIEKRLIEGVETIGNSSYGRTFHWLTHEEKLVKGWFNAVHRPDKCAFNVTIELDDAKFLYPVCQKIRQVFDLNANVGLIESQLIKSGLPPHNVIRGLRIPSGWSSFEAGVRAVLGQQVSVKAATNLVNVLVEKLGDKSDDGTRIWFPTANQVARSDLSFLKMPHARRETLNTLAKWCENHPQTAAVEWPELKGIGPWTVDYTQMRGEGNTDIWLESDLGIKKALDIFPNLDAEQAKPWRSYLTFQMWSML
ncbi:MAG: helix-turn-helix domain-containing protein [Gammaproteobacteria bacterium]|nr:helix-turn-helix domain-containing protein [Gammaproteobacteria bacterium]